MVSWQDVEPEHANQQYTCGYCHTAVYGRKATAPLADGSFTAQCPACSCLSTFNNVEDDGGLLQYPPEPAGPPIKGLPKPIDTMYIEACKAYSGGMPYACNLVCVELIKHIKLDGYKPGADLASCIEGLKKTRYMTPALSRMADAVLEVGTRRPGKKDKMLMDFTVQLLRTVYEVRHQTEPVGPKRLVVTKEPDPEPSPDVSPPRNIVDSKSSS